MNRKLQRSLRGQYWAWFCGTKAINSWPRKQLAACTTCAIISRRNSWLPERRIKARELLRQSWNTLGSRAHSEIFERFPLQFLYWQTHKFCRMEDLRALDTWSTISYSQSTYHSWNKLETLLSKCVKVQSLNKEVFLFFRYQSFIVFINISVQILKIPAPICRIINIGILVQISK